MDDIAVGDDESDIALPHLRELLHGVADIPQVGIGQKDVILDDSPEDAEMLVAEDFHRHDAGLAQSPEVRNLRLVACALVAQLFHEALHVQKREGPQLLDLLLVAILDEAFDNLPFREIFPEIIVEQGGQGGGTAGIIVLLFDKVGIGEFGAGFEILMEDDRRGLRSRGDAHLGWAAHPAAGKTDSAKQWQREK